MKVDISVDGRPVALDEGRQASDILEIDRGLYSVLYRGRSYEVRIQNSGGEWRATVDNRSFSIDIQDPRNGSGRANATLGHMHQEVKAPMPGKVIRLLVSEGDEVQAGQGLAVMEAMKMQNELKSMRAGRVIRIGVKDGDTVGAGDVLVTLE